MIGYSAEFGCSAVTLFRVEFSTEIFAHFGEPFLGAKVPQFLPSLIESHVKFVGRIYRAQTNRWAEIHKDRSTATLLLQSLGYLCCRLRRISD